MTTVGVITRLSAAADWIQTLLTMSLPTVPAPSGEEADWHARFAD
jgi:hypothetical protein